MIRAGLIPPLPTPPVTPPTPLGLVPEDADNEVDLVDLTIFFIVLLL